MKNLELSLMTTDYHRTHPLFSGAVSINGAKLNVCPPPVQGDACYKPVYEQFDVAEMSLSWYVMARCRGEPLIALPVFPLRMFIQPYLFCRNPEEISGPESSRGEPSVFNSIGSPSVYGRGASSKSGTVFIMARYNGSRPSRRVPVIAFRRTSSSSCKPRTSKRFC